MALKPLLLRASTSPTILTLIADNKSPRPWPTRTRPSSSHLKPAMRHPLYYLEDGNIILLVENTLFKIHRYFLKRESAFFLSMLALPQAEGMEEGLTDEKPIPLGDTMHVTLKEMESFLHFVYHSIHDTATPDLDGCMALLSFADRLDCPGIRCRALAQLNKLEPALEPVQRIVVAIKYDLDSWLLPAYTALCVREKPLTFEEGEELGLRRALLLAEAREQARGGKLPRVRRAGCCSGCDGDKHCECCGLHGVVMEPGPYEESQIESVVKKVFRM